MTTTTLPPFSPLRVRGADGALAAYEEIADLYDLFTRGHDYDRFLDVIEQRATANGLSGLAVLDVACGTGKSFMPLLSRGYSVTACDLSPAMVELARQKSGGLADVFVADMRELPDVGLFDLVTCLDDSFNYLLTDDEVEVALRGIARMLRPGGLLVFDVNTLHTYRTIFTQTCASDEDGVFFCWRGETPPGIESGGGAAATLEAFVSTTAGGWERRCSQHVQRHHPRTTISALCTGAGLDVLEIWGQHPGVRLDPNPAEREHTKFLYLARRSAACNP